MIIKYVKKIYFQRIHLKLFNIILTILISVIKPNKNCKKFLILFGGEYYNGNLKSLYEEFRKLRNFNNKPFEIYWIVKHRKEIKKFQKEGVKTLWFYGIGNIPKFLKANIWINDRGKGDIPIPKLKNSFWVQAWHGIPFKGFAGCEKTRESFNEFDLHPVSSQWLKDYYVQKIGVKEDKVVVTGYPRIDRLLKPYYNRNQIIKEIGLNQNQPILLYAPTWEHESGKVKPLFPFQGEIKFLNKLILFLERNNLQMVIRLHPNYRYRNEEVIDLIKKTDRIIQNSVRENWDTGKFLYISDILITDWSSIANDFIVLNRPIIFLDVPFELFKYGYALRPEERAGKIVKDEEEFFKSILQSLSNPKEYENKRNKIIKKIHFQIDVENSKRTIKTIEKFYAR